MNRTGDNSAVSCVRTTEKPLLLSRLFTGTSIGTTRNKLRSLSWQFLAQKNDYERVCGADVGTYVEASNNTIVTNNQTPCTNGCITLDLLVTNRGH